MKNDVVDALLYKNLAILLVTDKSESCVWRGKCVVCVNINSDNPLEDLAHELLHCLGLNEEEVNEVLTTIKRYGNNG